MLVSQMAETLIGSEIIKLAGDIRQKIAEGKEIYNFTIGDFDPAVFPIPEVLEQNIIKAYQDKHTNYPPAEGVLPLRKAVVNFIKKYQNLDYPLGSVLIGGGARPMIYSIYTTLLDAGDTVVFPVPSWNNNHYCHLTNAKPIFVEALPEDNFMPTAANLAPHLKGATLLSLCSPLNPTGTVFTKESLSEICELVLAENASRGKEEKPLYVLYDQIYSLLTFHETQHYNPVSLCPEMRDYTIFVDGISKCFAATGIRVGWAFGPEHVINKMKSILSHIGAWSPKAEQIASAEFMENEVAVEGFLSAFKPAVVERLESFHKGIQLLKNEGFAVDSIAPQAAIYLTLKFALYGKHTAEGKLLETTSDITDYILNEAGLAIVPFSAFGASADSPWYRMSVGTCKMSEVEAALKKLRGALQALK